MNNEKIAQFLKSLRTAKGYTQQQVADLLHISPKTISKWENGDGLPDISIISVVADVYDVSVDEILKGKKDIDDKVIRRQENKPKLTGLLKAQMVRRLSIYIYVGLGINILLLMIGMIILSTTNYTAGLFINFIGTILLVVTMILGYKDYQHQIEFETDEFVIQTHKDLRARIQKQIYFTSIFGLIIFFLCVYLPWILARTYHIQSIEIILFIFSMMIVTVFVMVKVYKMITEEHITYRQKIKKDILYTMSAYFIFMLINYGVIFDFIETLPGYMSFDGPSIILPEITPIHVAIFFQEHIPSRLFVNIYLIGVAIYILWWIIGYYKPRFRKFISLLGGIVIILSLCIYYDLENFGGLYIGFTAHTALWGIGLITLFIYSKIHKRDPVEKEITNNL